MNSFSIIIPVFNEEKNVEPLLKEILNTLNSQYENFEVIFINDCSSDESLSRIKSLCKIYPKKIKVISNALNIGQSFSIISGIKHSLFDTIVTLDADGQNNPKDIPKLLKKFFSNNEVYLVGGIRKNRKDSFIKKISSKVAIYVRKSILNDNCTDTGCSLKVFDKFTFMQFPFFNGIHRFLPALFSGYGKKTIFIDVDHRPRVFGYSKYGTYDRFIRGIRDLIRVTKIIKQFKQNK